MLIENTNFMIYPDRNNYFFFCYLITINLMIVESLKALSFIKKKT